MRALLITWIAVVQPAVVCAQDAEAPAARDRAKQLLDSGNQLVGEGDYTEALAAFREAYSLFPSPKLLLNIGTTLRLRGQNVDAAEAYEAFLAHPEADPARNAQVKKALQEIDQLVGRVRIRVTSSRASIRLDNQEVGAGPIDLTRRVAPGEHTVVVQRAGMVPNVRTIEVRAGITEELSLEPLAPGKRVETKFVEIETGTAQRIAAITLGAAGVAGLAVGAVLGGLAWMKNDEASEHCSAQDRSACDSRGVQLGNAASDLALGSTIGFAAALELVPVAMIMFFTAPSRDAADSKPVAGKPVAAAPAGYGLGVRGTW